MERDTPSISFPVFPKGTFQVARQFILVVTIKTAVGRQFLVQFGPGAVLPGFVSEFEASRDLGHNARDV